VRHNHIGALVVVPSMLTAGKPTRSSHMRVRSTSPGALRIGWLQNLPILPVPRPLDPQLAFTPRSDPKRRNTFQLRRAASAARLGRAGASLRGIDLPSYAGACWMNFRRPTNWWRRSRLRDHQRLPSGSSGASTATFDFRAIRGVFAGDAAAETGRDLSPGRLQFICCNLASSYSKQRPPKGVCERGAG
jgi:hypothetical protein